MEAKPVQRKFVHVVAMVDLAAGTGQIRYVNPATTGVVSDDPGHPDIEMSVESEAGNKQKTWHPVVRFASCEAGEFPSIGLIQEDVAYEPWMKTLRLRVKGVEVSKYEAGVPGAAAGLAARTASAGGAALRLEAASAERPNRRLLGMLEEPREGVTYTVQVRPEGSQAWQTIAVGRTTSQTEIDRNQFPGSRRLDVRVIQTTGFDESVIAEQKFDIEK